MEINNAINIRPAAVTNKTVTTNDTQVQAEREVSASSESQEQDSQARELQPDEIESVVANLNDYAQTIKRDLSFSLQNDTGKVVVEVTDSATGELIRKIPSEEALELSERIAEVKSLMTSVKA